MATKKATYYYNAWKNATRVYLWETYTTWSSAKAKAWQWCEEKCMNTKGKRFRIISRNTFGFSVAWISDDEKTLYVETPKNSYVFDL